MIREFKSVLYRVMDDVSGSLPCWRCGSVFVFRNPSVSEVSYDAFVRVSVSAICRKCALRLALDYRFSYDELGTLDYDWLRNRLRTDLFKHAERCFPGFPESGSVSLAPFDGANFGIAKLEGYVYSERVWNHDLSPCVCPFCDDPKARIGLLINAGWKPVLLKSGQCNTAMFARGMFVCDNCRVGGILHALFTDPKFFGMSVDVLRGVFFDAVCYIKDFALSAKLADRTGDSLREFANQGMPDFDDILGEVLTADAAINIES